MAISELLKPAAPPLREDAGGVLRIGRTRVSLDSVLTAYQEGAGADEIALRFPSLTLAEIHAVLSFYHRNRASVEAYLREAEEEEDRLQASAQAHAPGGDTRERMLARRAARDAQVD